VGLYAQRVRGENKGQNIKCRVTVECHVVFLANRKDYKLFSAANSTAVVCGVWWCQDKHEIRSMKFETNSNMQIRNTKIVNRETYLAACALGVIDRSWFGVCSLYADTGQL